MVEFGPNGQVIDDAAGQVPIAVKDGVYKAEGKTFHALTGRYKFLRFSLAAYFFGLLGVGLCNLVEVYSLNALGSDPYMMEGAVGTVFSISMLTTALVGILAYLLSIVAVCMWTHRAMTNLHIIRSPLVEMSPNWAVGWHFIPFANLFKPYQGMAQIWDGSEEASAKPLLRRGRLNWWWGTWIVSTLITNISMRVFGLSPEGEEYVLSLYFDIVSAIIGLVSIYLLLKITQQITDAQSQIQDGGLEATFA